MNISALCLALLALGIQFSRAQTNDAPPELRDARVTIPYQELKALWLAAHPALAKAETKKPEPPVKSALLSARYEIALGETEAEGLAEFEVQSFTDGWTMIPLLGADAQLDAVEPPDAQVIVKDDYYALVTNRVGKVSVKLRFATEIASVGGDAAFKLTTPGALVKVLTVTKLPTGKIVRIAGATQISSEKTGTSFRLPFRDEIAAEIVAAKTLAPPLPSKWKIETQAFVQSADRKLHYVALIAASTDGGTASNIELKLPAGARVGKVSGAGAINWAVIHPDDQTLRLQIRWPGAAVFQREFEVEYETPQPVVAGDWKLRAPEVVEGESTGTIFALIAEEGVELTPTNPLAVASRLPRWLAEHAGNKNATVVAEDGAVRGKILPLVRAAQAVVERAAGKTLVVTDGAVLGELSYSIRHEAPLAWQLQMPKGSELIACTVNGRQMNPIKRDGEKIEFPLPTPAAGATTEIKLSYTARKPAFKPVSGQLQVELPLTDLLIRKLDWELHIPFAYELAALQGNVETVTGPDRADDGSRLIRLHKALCKSEAPNAEIFYQKPESKK